MSQLGLQEVLVRLERFEGNVSSNIDRLGDQMLGFDRKVDELTAQCSKISGVLETHIDSDQTWRSDLSGRIHMIESDARRHAKEAVKEATARTKATEERLQSELDEAKAIAVVARDARLVWNARVGAITAAVALITTLLGGMAAYFTVAKSARTAAHAAAAASAPAPLRP